MKKFAPLALVAVFLLASCAQVITSVFDATLVVRVARPARTLVDFPAADHYTATLTREGAKAQVADLNGTGPTPIVISTGNWTVVVAAFDPTGTQVGEGSATIVATPGENSVTVTVSPSRKGFGDFDITLNYSEQAQTVGFSLRPWPTSATSPVVSVSPLEEAPEAFLPLTDSNAFLTDAMYELNISGKHAEFTGTLKSGDYLLQITTTASGVTASYSEVLRVYDGGQITHALTRPSVMVHFDSNGATGTMADQPMPFGYSSQLNKSTFSFPGKAFVGWTKDSAGITPLILDEANYLMQSATTVTLYAKWLNQYEVVFDANGGSGALSPVTLTVGSSGSLTSYSSATMPPPTSLALFRGWTRDRNENGTSTLYSDGANFQMPSDATANVTLYAQWTYRYQVLFHANGGTGTMSPLVVAVGYTVNLPTMSALTGPSGRAVFGGWNTAANASGTSYANGASFQMPAGATGDVILYAKWSSVPVYALNVSSSNTAYGTVSVQEGAGPFTAGTTIHLTATPLANYAFVNWAGDISGVAGARSAVTTLTMPAAAVTITANFSVPSTGALSSTDRRSKGRGADYYADIYSFTISTAQTVTISMVAPNKDSFLFLYKDTWGGNPISYNDDSGGTLDSMIGPISLVPGTYFVDATSYQMYDAFSYTLTASSTSGAIALTQY